MKGNKYSTILVIKIKADEYCVHVWRVHALTRVIPMLKAIENTSLARTNSIQLVTTNKITCNKSYKYDNDKQYKMGK